MPPNIPDAVCQNSGMMQPQSVNRTSSTILSPSLGIPLPETESSDRVMGPAEEPYCSIRIRIPDRIRCYVSKKNVLNPWQTAYSWLRGLYVTDPLGHAGSMRLNYATGIVMRAASSHR